MNSCYIDSNIFISLVDENSPFHQTSIEVLKDIVGKKVKIFVSPLVFDECLNIYDKLIKRNKNKFSLDLGEFLNSILGLSEIQIVNPSTSKSAQRQVIYFMKEYGLRPRDAYHLLTCLNNKVESIATFDKDFDKVFNSKLINRFTINEKS
jgi:predicted nucleic acid-binding protein